MTGIAKQLLSMTGYENGYLGITSIDFKPLIDKMNEYISLLDEYVSSVNKPCAICNSFDSIAVYSQLILVTSEYKVYRFDNKYVLVFVTQPKLFLVLDNQTPAIIINILDMFYKDVTSDTALPATTLKGEYLGNELAVYVDKYCVCTMYENICENYVYTPMTISDKKKFTYRRHLYNRAFTYESKRNCSC
jgi:hypothetical protein